nr:hypothetical protein CFP56_56453 [Quercus suber]
MCCAGGQTSPTVSSSIIILVARIRFRAGGKKCGRAGRRLVLTGGGRRHLGGDAQVSADRISRGGLVSIMAPITALDIVSPTVQRVNKLRVSLHCTSLRWVMARGPTSWKEKNDGRVLVRLLEARCSGR